MNRIFGYDSPIVGALTKIGDIICLSVLWLVFSLPIFTIGAATVALYTAAYRYLRSGKGSLWKTFWGAFRGEFKRSTLCWLVGLLLLAVLTVDVFVLRGIKMADKPFGNLYWVALIAWCLVLTWTVYLAAYIARVNGGVRDSLRFGYMLMLLHPIRALGVMLIVLAGLAAVLMVPFMVLAMPTVVLLICSFPLEKIFLAHLPTEDKEAHLTDSGEREEQSDDQ